MGSNRSNSNRYLSRRYEVAQKSCDISDEPDRREENIVSYHHYHDHDCGCNDRCHHNKCDRCHECSCKCECKDQTNRFIEFDVDQSTTIFFPENNAPGTGNGNTNVRNLNSLAQVRVDVCDDDNDVELQGTIEWTPTDIPITAALLTALTTTAISVPLSLEGTFRIYRSCKEGHFPVPIFETTDTSVLNALDIATIVGGVGTLSIPLSTVTTSFHFVDEDPCCGDNRYFLTLDINLPNNPTLTVGGVTGLLSSFLPSLTFTSETRVFSATEIEEVDENNKRY